MKLSIVITVYNAEKYIERCARSLFEQSIEDVEFLFVNDCSPDKSIEILLSVLEEYPQRKKQTRIISFDMNGGSSHAKRVGIQEAKGDYIASVDSDDWLESDAYDKMLSIAESNNADIVCCEIVRETVVGRKYETYNYDIEAVDDVIEHLEYGIYSSLANKIISRSLFERYKILPIDGISMWDDLSATARLRYYSSKTIIIHEALYHYNCQNSDSVTTSKSNDEKISSMITCAEFLANHFKMVMPKKHYIKLMRLCFRAKAPLFYPPDYNLSKWKSAIHETNKYVICFKDISLLKRFQYILFLNLPTKFGDFLLKKHYNL